MTKPRYEYNIRKINTVLNREEARVTRPNMSRLACLTRIERSALLNWMRRHRLKIKLVKPPVYRLEPMD